MQQGIQSLMPQGPQQGPMPGQAPQMPMPGMMPKQGAPTPQAMVAPLTKLHLDQLTQLMLNPRPEGPPLYAVITAITKQQEQAKVKADMQRQMAMAQGQQAAQQPPIAQQVLAQAQQMQGQQPVMAAYGGEMHGYAGGGAVAFGGGGNPEIEQILKKSPMMRTPEENEKLRAAGIGLERRQPAPEGSGVDRVNRYLKGIFGDPSPVSYSSGIDEVLAAERGRKPTAMTSQQMEMATQSAPAAAPRPPGATRPGTGIAQGQNRPQAAPAPAPAEPGIAGLMGPMIEPERLAMRGAVDERQAAIRNAAKTPEDVLKARGGIDALMKEIVDSRRAEEQRLMTHSDKRLEEARARAAQSPLNDISYLGQMLEGMRGSKRFGEALAGAASGAGRAQTARSQALQAAEDKYDLSRRDIFNLANLRQQVQLDQAKLAEARATGDADRTNKAALELAQSKEALAKFEMDVSNKSREFGLEERKLAQQGQIAREQMANAIKVAGIGAAARESASDIAEKRFALQQLRADPEYTAAMNKIKELSKAAGMSNAPTVQAAFRAAQQEALAVAKRYGLTPKDIGATGADAGAAPAGNDPLGIRK